MSLLSVIADTMLPGDPALGLPPASRVDLEGAFRGGQAALVADFTAVLDEVSRRKFAAPFLELGGADRLAALNGCKVANVRVFAAFLAQVVRAYYADPVVLRAIGAGSAPPFPDGNALEADDWGLLEPVLERGPLFRKPGP